MSAAITIECAFRVHRGSQGRKVMRAGQNELSRAPGRLPRVTRLLALALRFEQLLRSGVIADYAALARLGHVSRARISQIMNLLGLAPSIQEEILFWPTVARGRDPIRLRQLQPLARTLDWSQQRKMWRRLKLL
jgi:hypothetical protein